jgi:Uma2 family endonuclease
MATAVLEQQKMTYEEYYNLGDDTLYQLIHGELNMSPAPSTYHQRVLMTLLQHILKYLEENKTGELLLSPVDVVFDKYNTVQPDLLVILNEHRNIIQERGVFGSPDIVFEIISPSSMIMDRHTKFELYEKHGVKEYWLIDINNKAVEVFELVDGKYGLFSSASIEGTVFSSVLEGFETDINGLFS